MIKPKSDNQLENIIVNGSNILKHSNSKIGNIIKGSSSFFESNNFDKNKEKDNNIYVNTENENININNKNKNYFYFTTKKPKMIEKKKNKEFLLSNIF